MNKNLPGVILRSLSSVFGDRVFYVFDGKRYWVRDSEWFRRNGFSWPNDLLDVSAEILYSYANGGVAPIFTRSDLEINMQKSSMDMREIIASKLKGTGLEFGAGASPFPVPIGCNVLYADIFSYEVLQEHIYPGQDSYNLIRPDYVTDIKTLKGIADNSLDFIVACHVIEHTNNPIAALDSCFRALKPGGCLILVVPDMQKTFDSSRALTKLDHLIEDWINPSSDRDFLHYEEFYTKALPIPPNKDQLGLIKQKQEEGNDIHYHVWTYENFEELVHWHASKHKWKIDFSCRTLKGEENIEFYFSLIKCE